MLASFILIFNFWRRSFVSIFFSFGLPIALFLIISVFLSPNSLLPSMLASVCLANGIITMSSMYVGFKNTIIKKLSISPFSPLIFILNLVIFNLIISFCSIALLLLIGWLTYGWDGMINFNYINWWWLLVTSLLGSSLSLLIGLILGIIFNQSSQTFNVGLLIYLITAFIARIYIPRNVPFFESSRVETITKAFDIIEWVSPYSALVSMFTTSFYYKLPDMEGIYKPLYGNHVALPCILLSIIIVILFGTVLLLQYYWKK